MGGKKNKKEKRIVEVGGCGGVREGVERKGGVLGGWLVEGDHRCSSGATGGAMLRCHWYMVAWYTVELVPLVVLVWYNVTLVHGGAAVPLAATSGHQLPNTVAVALTLCLYKYKYKTHRNVQIQKNSTNM